MHTTCQFFGHEWYEDLREKKDLSKLIRSLEPVINQ